MGTNAAKLMVKVGLGLVVLTFVFLLLDDEGNGNWAIGMALVWFLVGVATLILMTRRRYVRRARMHRHAASSRRLESRGGELRPSRRPLGRPTGGPASAKYLADHRD